ncbi:molybdate ABC transporter substrate-binding protein [Arcanobacterium canis]
MKLVSASKILIAIGVAVGLGGCSQPSSDHSASSASNGSVIVFGAASLNAVMPDISQQVFSPQFPGISVRFNFNGSSSLVDQMASGAPTDVLLTADEKNMNNALEQGLVRDPQVFTSNTLVLVVPRANPGAIEGFSNDQLDGRKIVTCAKRVPCGRATDKLVGLNKMTLHPVSEEQSVTDVLGKVTSGEADAGIVYKTDAKLAGDKVMAFEIPRSQEVVNRYMIAVAKDAPNPQQAQQFIQSVLSDSGQSLLEKYGFMKVAK